MDPGFWKGKRVVVTGHTGFKGGWLSLLLQLFGARVTGYALPQPTAPALFEAARVREGMRSLEGDVRDLDEVRQLVTDARPEVVFHLAAQPLVRLSYREPAETFATNVMGTVNVLEAVRDHPAVRVVVVVTSDKCYENREWMWGYRENEPVGGRDPYSSSKACAELVTSAYRNSFFAAEAGGSTTAVATARAGNVVGGGDWAADRIVPDAIRAFQERRVLAVRSPRAVRPWQHVLEPLSGYLTLAERLWQDGTQYAGRWNFGPVDSDAKPVAWLVERLAALWGGDPPREQRPVSLPHEATYLRLDCTKARSFLGWAPRLRIDVTLEWLVEWYRAYYAGHDVRKLTEVQIENYLSLPLLE